MSNGGPWPGLPIPLHCLRLMSRPRRSPTATVGTWLLAAAVVAAPLASGGVAPRVQLAVAGLTGLAFSLLAVGADRAPALALVLLVPMAVGALQTLPLAGGRPLSLDPPATGRELASSAAMVLAFAGAWVLAGTKQRRERLVQALGVAGVAVALAAVGAALVGAGPLLNGAFPFVNPNHQGGLLNLAAFALLGITLRSHGQARFNWLIGFVLVVLALFATLSRGAIAAFLGGAALFLLLASRRQRPAPEEAPRPWRRPVLAGLVAGLGAVAYLLLDPVLRELTTFRGAGDQVKLSLWRPALQLIQEHPWFGIGRGAWATVFGAYKVDPSLVTFTHVENSWLQPLVDLGVPAGLLLIGTYLLIWLRLASRRDLSTVEVGLLAGTAAVAAQGLVDFSLEFVGVGVPFAVAMGLLSRGAWPVRLRWPWQVAGAGVVLATALGGMLLWRAHPTEGDANKVTEAATPEDAAQLAEEALRWHPADYLPAARAGARWVEADRCSKAMPWLMRAMQLNPTAPEPHQLAARCLAAAGQGPAARREYRLAGVFGSPTALEEAAGRFDQISALMEVVPDDADGLLRLGEFLSNAGRPEDAVVALRRALDEHQDTRALAPLARALVLAGEPEEGLAVARRRIQETPDDPEGWRFAANAQVALEQEEEARATLEEGLKRRPGSPRLVEALTYRLLAARRPAEARRVAEGMTAQTPFELALRELLIASSLAAQGRTSEALDRAQSASGYYPDSPWPLSAVSSYAQAAGRMDEAIAAVERAAALPGQGAAAQEAYRKRIAELQTLKAQAPERRLRDELKQGR